MDTPTVLTRDEALGLEGGRAVQLGVQHLVGEEYLYEAAGLHGLGHDYGAGEEAGGVGGEGHGLDGCGAAGGAAQAAVAHLEGGAGLGAHDCDAVVNHSGNVKRLKD